MSQTDFEEAFKKLESRVQYLEDKLIKQQRENADLLEQLTSLSDSGVSTALVGKLNKKFSEIVQTEGKISSTVADLSDETRKKYSKIEQTAEKIETEVGAVYNEVLIGTNGNPVTNPEAYESYKGSLVSWNGNNYRYSSLLGKWEKVDGNSISSSFKQTADGFYLDGDVKIDGNTYQNGKIISSSFYATGNSGQGSAIYIYKSNETSNSENKVGFISYESSEPEEFSAGEKIVIASEMGKSLKLVTYADSNKEIESGNISIGAGMHRDNHTYAGYGGYIYIGSPISFSGGHIGIGDSKSDILFGNDPYNKCQVDFTYANVIGLHAVFE